MILLESINISDLKVTELIESNKQLNIENNMLKNSVPKEVIKEIYIQEKVENNQAFNFEEFVALKKENKQLKIQVSSLYYSFYCFLFYSL